MNEWLKRNHLKSRTDYSFGIRDNMNPIVLVWENEVFDEMPVLHQKWGTLQVEYQVHFGQCEMKQRNERLMKWSNVFTNL
jgi:hypothetical protein